MADKEKMHKRDRKMPIDAALIVCGLANNQSNAKAEAVTAFQHEGMATVANFAHMTDKDVIEMCKTVNNWALTLNGCQVGALKVKSVRVLACWARDLQNRQRPIDDNGFDAAALANAMIMLDTDNATDETDLKKPPKFEPDHWDIWEPEFVNHMKSIQRQTGAPLDCIVRDPTKTVKDFPATDEANRLIFAMALNGPVHQQDNHRVALKLHSFIAGTSAANFVREGSEDDRGMMTTLQDHCNGPGEVPRQHN